MLKHQALAGNFPMRLRWNFHRLMLGQSMGFYQDEFAGRIATKVMQTALAVRDTWLILPTSWSTWSSTSSPWWRWWAASTPGCWPFLGWLVLYIAGAVLLRAAPGKVAQAQADARSLMTGRITDAYTNIATVKLFSHRQREAGFARGAMQEFMATVHGADAPGERLRDRQPQPAQRGLLIGHRRRPRCGCGCRAGGRGRGGGGHRDGAAAERHLALGDVGDGLAVRACRHGAGRHGHAVAPALGGGPPTPQPLQVPRGEVRFEHVASPTAAARR
jgi:hypothetical protein